MIYFVHSDQYIKIGFSGVQSRVFGDDTYNPHAMTLIGSIPGDVERERELHQEFSHLRHRGEWFRAHYSLVFFIEEKLKEEGAIYVNSKFLATLKGKANPVRIAEDMAKRALSHKKDFDEWVERNDPERLAEYELESALEALSNYAFYIYEDDKDGDAIIQWVLNLVMAVREFNKARPIEFATDRSITWSRLRAERYFRLFNPFIGETGLTAPIHYDPFDVQKYVKPEIKKKIRCVQEIVKTAAEDAKNKPKAA
jgi:hypothetical protein